MTDQLLCVAGGFATTRDAEHAYADAVDLVGVTAYAATTFEPHEKVVVTGAERADALPERARLFVFPGHEELTGVVRVADLLARSAVDEVRGLGGVDPGPDEGVQTQGFVRPLVEDGRVVLTVRPFDDGTGTATYAPFEQPNPTPCCAAH